MSASATFDPRSDRQWVEAMLDHVGYKPDWTIELLPANPTMPSFEIYLLITIRNAPDSVRWVREREITRAKVESKALVPEFMLWHREGDRFIEWLRHELQRLEAHEFDEFFHDPTTKKPYHDPHAGRG